MINSALSIDYTFLNDILIINQISVLKEYQRKGLGSDAVLKLERLAKLKNCFTIFTPSDLSKIALRFWLKNGFMPSNIEQVENIETVLNSKEDEAFIFDIDCNSVVELYKKIK